jgi:ABC-type Fe3+-hydroxamate transport system substrate-binding protein
VNSGTYNVSARLLEGNLRVDDGWIGRKNPGVIVKIVDSSVLGSGVFSTGAAQKVHAGLLSRDGWQAIDAVRNGRVLILSEELLKAPYLQTAAMLIIAKTANPALFEDVETEKALEILIVEATGSLPSGIYYYHGQGAF